MFEIQKKIFGTLEKLSQNPTGLKLKILNGVFEKIIPFNQKMGINILRFSDEMIKVQLPYKKRNFNHIKGIHACALATLGEFCSGVLLTKAFPVSKYRPIMENLEATYYYQAKKKIEGVAKLSPEAKEKAMEEIKSGSKTTVAMTTEIFDVDNNHIATVKTNWQIKEWSQVRTKT